MTAPVIESGDILDTTNTANQTTQLIDHQAYVSGDLMIQFYGGDDDLATDSLTAPTEGPNGETLLISSVGSGGASASGPVQGVVAWIGDATISAGSLTWTRGNPEQSFGRCIKVLAGEFDATTPLGTLSDYDGNSSTTGSTIPTPGNASAWNAGASDGGGTIVVMLTTDADPITDPPVSGWTLLNNSDGGACANAVAVRDAETTDSESIASVDYTIASDSSSTIGVIIRGTVSADILQAQVMM